MSDPKELAESGILLVDKPGEWTSHDVVNCIRRRFGITKVGHCGTLDPVATGLLVIVMGRATKLSAHLTATDKVYAGTMRLGIETFTEDSDGEVVATADTSQVTAADVTRAAAAFVGDIMQVPPMVSAIKQGGKPLYKLARKGQEVEREPRPVHIHYLRIADIRLPDVDFEVSCSKGTYIRTLCADMGRALGCGAHMLALRRLACGSFHLRDAHTMDELKTWERAELLSAMTPLATVLVELATKTGTGRSRS